MPAIVVWLIALVTETDWRKVVRCIEVATIAILMLVIAWLWYRVHSVERARAALALRAYNDSARADHLQAIAMSQADSVRLLGDSLAAVTQLAVQQTQKADDFDRLLKQRRVATVGVTGQVRSVTVSAALPAADSSGGRGGPFTMRDEPYTIHGEVWLPAPPAPGRITVSVALDSLQLHFRLGCQPPNADGVRPARLAIFGPPWLAIKSAVAETDPSVCNTGAVLGAPGSWFRPQLVIAAGLTVPDRRGSLFVGVSILHWPRR